MAKWNISGWLSGLAGAIGTSTQEACLLGRYLVSRLASSIEKFIAAGYEKMSSHNGNGRGERPDARRCVENFQLVQGCAKEQVLGCVNLAYRLSLAAWGSHPTQPRAQKLAHICREMRFTYTRLQELSPRLIHDHAT